MTTHALTPSNGGVCFSTKIKAVLSVALFWCTPVSAIVSIMAVRATSGTSGWPREVARTGAFLTIGWVAYLTVAIAWMLYVIVWNPALA